MVGKSDQMVVKQYEFFTYDGKSYVGDILIENAVYIGMFGGKDEHEALNHLKAFLRQKSVQFKVQTIICREVNPKTYSFTL